MRALIVDDEQPLRTALIRLVRHRSRHIQVEEAAGVREALARLAAADYDIVVSDQQMPDGTGIYLLLAVRERHNGCLTGLMSGHYVESDFIENRPYDRFFRKPDDMMAVAEWIRFESTNDAWTR